MYPQNASSCSSLIPLGGDEEVGIELRVERCGGRLNDILAVGLGARSFLLGYILRCFLKSMFRC